ncbi:MAG: GPR endopeptidase [Clostridia bacterium]|nr:GPR endopeptidase [Clostridia bacterium]
MTYFTDLALERSEISGELDGVYVTEQETDGLKTTVVQITNAASAERLGKAVGTYITLESPVLFELPPAADGAAAETLAHCLTRLLPEGEGPVLVAGVGNPEITADALGPRAASGVFATRHIDEDLRSEAGVAAPLRPVAVVCADVLGKTGIETAEILRSLVPVVKPCAVVTVDALAARRVERLGTTVQLSDTGIAPGSGVGNSRRRIDASALGVPVIAVGVPTVISSAVFAGEESDDGLVVTPKDADKLVRNAAAVIALALNRALQPALSREELLALS